MKALVTGGAGFIGSHLADRLDADGHTVRVLDDLSNGRSENIAPGIELVTGSVADPPVVATAMDGVDVVFHQAALGSVKRSVEDPLATNRANIDGSLTVLHAAQRAGVQRVVAASSSSVYGGVAPLPSREDFPPAPKSPYGVTKVALESYCSVYAELLGLETVCLRYFNVYGPRQRADSEYPAAIPLFIDALRSGTPPTVHGDGEQTRDFTFVADAVSANVLAAAAPADRVSGRIYNIGGGARRRILDVLETLERLLGVDAHAVHTEPRAGDVRDSQADISAARADLGYEPSVDLEEGLRQVLEASR